MKKIIVAVTGASGHPYAMRLLNAISHLCELHVVFSKMANLVFYEETQKKPEEFLESLKNIKIHEYHNFFSPLASGSNPFDALIIIPCSMKTLGQISCGTGENLITRLADIAMKERRKMILVPREAPLSSIHLENMLRISKEGGIILPACPGFYHKPQNIEDILDFLVQRICDLCELKISLIKPWAEDKHDPS